MWIITAPALLVFAAGAFGLAREVWQFNGFAARNAATQSACQNNLKQMGLVYKMFAYESQGEVWPQLSGEEGNLLFRWQEVFPEYVTNRDVLVCPGPAGEPPANTFTDQYYVYTGYALSDQEDLEAFATAYSAEIAAGGDFSENLSPPSGGTVLRLREGIERFLITDINDPAAGAKAQSKLPVMWEWPDNHDTGYGSNVLYMDGHVEWVYYGEKFPVTEEAFAALGALAHYVAPTDWSSNHIRPTTNAPYDHPASCANNLKQVGLVNKMYANESSGEVLPPLSSEGGRVMIEDGAVYPEYLSYRGIYACTGRRPLDPEIEIDDEHYVYLGYLLANDSDVQQFATAYRQVIAAGGDFSGNLPVSASYGPALLRLHEDIVRDLSVEITEPTQDFIGQHNIPVVVEWPENHENNSGGNVLFMDGHVEWMPYPGEFPMTEATITTLRDLAENTPATTWALPDDRPDPYGYLRTCKGYMNQWGLVAKMYGNESQGQVWPPLSLVPGELAMRDDEVYPEYINPRYIGVCPGTGVDDDIDHFDDRHYVYLGYVMRNDSDVQQFVAGYNAEVAAGGDFSEDLPVSTSYGDTMIRLREGIERFLITDINNPAVPLGWSQYQVPVMIEWPGNHEGLTGGHVLYMDGHTEWHDYPSEFPMTESTISALDSIADWTPTTAWGIPRFPGPGDEYDHGLCGLNERMFGLSFKIYANQSKGEHFPPLSQEYGKLMTEDEIFLRYHLRETRRMNCPGSVNAYRQPIVDDHSYAYLGYVIQNQEELERFAAAYQQQASGGGDFTENIDVGGETVYRLREGIERFLITDINSPAVTLWSQRTLPVMVEWPDNHGDVRGGNVLYMDGHTKWLDYPSEFPMTEAAMAILTNIAGRDPIREPSPPKDRSRLESLLSLGEDNPK